MSPPFQCLGTILAGCSSATAGAKVLLRRLLVRVQSQVPAGRYWNVVDDISCVVLGTLRLVEKWSKQVLVLFTDGLEALRLPLSRGKCKILSTHKGLGDSLAGDFHHKGFVHCKWARNVGVDAVIGGKRMHRVAKGRILKLRRRASRLRRLRRACTRTDHLVASCQSSVGLWGRE